MIDVNGKYEVRYEENYNKNLVQHFQKYSKEEQIEILKVQDESVIKFTDTLFILDTVAYFKKNKMKISYGKKTVVIQILRAPTLENCENCLRIYKPKENESSLIVAFRGIRNEIFYTYKYTKIQGKLKLTERRTYPGDPHFKTCG